MNSAYQTRSRSCCVSQALPRLSKNSMVAQKNLLGPLVEVGEVRLMRVEHGHVGKSYRDEAKLFKQE